MNAGQWLLKAEAYLNERGVPEGRANAEFIMADSLDVGRGDVLLRRAEPVSERLARRFWSRVLRRGQRLPLAYVLGFQPFLGLDIKVTPAVLIPRPETEELVMAAAALLEPRRGEPLNVLEIGTGSGCVAIALAELLPHAAVYATDLSRAALELAAENAARHDGARRIRFVREDLFKESGAAKGWADLVISNPPYIPTAELAALAPEVLEEPRLALDGGRDGLAALRAIIAAVPRYLKPGGWLALEIGATQGHSVAWLMETAGLTRRAVRQDMQGLDRVAIARK